MRYFEWDQQRSWIIIKDDEQVIEIPDEWPDRRKLLSAFRRHLSGFNAREAKRAFIPGRQANGYALKRRQRSPLLK
jgi:hypothetical protein